MSHILIRYSRFMRHREAFTALHNDVFPTTYYDAATIISRLSHNNQLWLLLEHDKLIGYAYFEVAREFGNANLHYIAIHPQAHNQGYGTKLLAETLSHMFAFDEINDLQLSVTRGNAQANRVYEKVGFVTKRELHNYHLSRS